MRAFALAFSFFIVASLAAPPLPIWPDEFSATVHVTRQHNRRTHNYRWFYSQSQQKDRIDGLVDINDEHYTLNTFYDHPKGIEYQVYYQPNLVFCYTKQINTTLPKPDFRSLHYVGKSLVDYSPAHHWSYDDHARAHRYQVYDRQDNRRVLRIDIDNERTHRVEIWKFWEWDVGRQDPDIFVIPAAILEQCTPAPH